MTTTPTPQPRSIYNVETAKIIRTVLKANFPKVKFSVRSRHGSSVDISWTDGPTRARVESLVSCFKAGHFDGMTDSYEYHNAPLIVEGESVRTGTRFVFCSREIGDKQWARLSEIVAAFYGMPVPSRKEAENLRVPAAESNRGYVHFSELVRTLAADRTARLYRYAV